jgi:hypothetical protein
MPTVNEADFWRRIGRILQSVRGERLWSQVKKDTGIDTKTLQSIEAGRPGLVEKISLYARYLELDLVDVIRSVLSEEKRPFSTSVAEIRRLVVDLPDDAQQSLLLVTRSLAQRQRVAAPPTETEQRPEPQRRGRRTT